MPIIEVNHLTKEYQLGHITSLKENVFNTFRRLARNPVQQRENFKALDDVNFSIEEGEVVGIIGHNGAGKSTLLKHLANISKPTKGKVIVRGSIAPLIEVGAGVNPELTGRENIFLNGAILGIPKKIIQQKLDEIINFSELEQFIDTPVKRYSSGMTVKLGFSIATSLDADILIIDEVLAVGDLAFQRKCFDKMEDMINRQGKTVLLVSHNIRQVERLCSRVLLFDHGKILLDGNPKSVCNKFYELSEMQIKEAVQKNSSAGHSNSNFANDEIEVLTVKLLDDQKKVTDAITLNKSAYLTISFEVKKTLKNLIFGAGIHTTDLLYLASSDTENELLFSELTPGKYELFFHIHNFPFLPGTYSFRAGISAGTPPITLYYAENLSPFNVNSSDNLSRAKLTECGFIKLKADWELDKTQ